MREIDCSGLPDNLAKIALTAAKKTIKRSPYDPNGVTVLEKTQIVTLNGDGRQTLRLYGSLRQAMLSAVEEELSENYTEYPDNARQKYFDAIKFRNP